SRRGLPPVARRDVRQAFSPQIPGSASRPPSVPTYRRPEKGVSTLRGRVAPVITRSRDFTSRPRVTEPAARPLGLNPPVPGVVARAALSARWLVRDVHQFEALVPSLYDLFLDLADSSGVVLLLELGLDWAPFDRRERRAERPRRDTDAQRLAEHACLI